MDAYPPDSAASAPPNHGTLAARCDNQREYASRHELFKQSFCARPTAYAPYGSQDEHPLHDAYTQLQARLQAVRDVRSKLRFVASSTSFRGMRKEPTSATANTNTPASGDSMAISTRVALSAQPSTDQWVQRGGIVALDGLETLFLGFLTTHELVTAGAVCQSWYALARRDVFWDPLLVTPVEKYPLRAFLGLHAGVSIPAMHVYMIFRKMRAQLHTLDAKHDEAPRQSPDALRFEEGFLRHRRVAHGNLIDNQGLDLDADDAFALPLMAQLGRRRVSRGNAAASSAATVNGTPRLHLRSVHLLFPADENLGAVEEDTPMLDGGFRDGVVHPLPQPQFDRRAELANALHLPPPRHQRDQFFVPDIESDEEIWIDGEGHNDEDVAMLPPDGIAVAAAPEIVTAMAAAVSTPHTLVDACRRVRLLTWLTKRRSLSRDEFRSFARQLLLALATLEVSQLTHSDVCTGNILVLDRGATAKTELPHAMSPPGGAGAGHQPAPTSQQVFPLFQLYCRSSVNIWSTHHHHQPLYALDQQRQRLGPAAPPAGVDVPPAPRTAEDILLQRALHHRRLAAMAAQPELDDDDYQGALHRRLAIQALPRPWHDAGAGLIPPPVQLQAQAPISASYVTMVRSYIRILREVWTRGRVASTAERSLSFLSLIYLRPSLVKSVSLRSFIEYAEYLVSRNEASPIKLLNHIFLQPSEDRTSSSSPRPNHTISTSNNNNSGSTGPPRFIVGRSSMRPLSSANADDYRNSAIAWYARYLSSHQTQHVPRNVATSVDTLGSLTTPSNAPSTLLGPSFFHDALSESRLPFQRFLSVVAPRTASSSWVRTLAISQRYTLQQLDLSLVELPLSILLRELQHLQRLSHLRLPREILRDENMEQFVAALWCSGLLPTLQVMDDSVKKALDRMEFGYATQLNIMASLLEQSSGGSSTQPELPHHLHTFSAPF